ncbi:MAG: acyl carrier protein [Candidatus Mcinerneyibacterium aminivorans]|jgi:acyl carrier protein|uniref:Acyl carrier protein n=1 Tax=Candidatus Mcinerneyibacterium aminivorans TaxID=2703815 RepID=A0A5D0MHS8_9BACT|nr:MAG: acyl carrier protein [Candidatus Mcinerneyibacterium aminivorans]
MDKKILETVKELTAEQLGIEVDEVNEKSSFIDDLGADSLDTMELVLALEDEFGIEISDEETEKLKTVADAVKYIEDNK